MPPYDIRVKGNHLNIIRWSQQIIGQLENKEILPDYLKQLFAGLSNHEVIDKLKRYNAHLIVHLGLKYSTESSGYLLTSR